MTRPKPSVANRIGDGYFRLTDTESQKQENVGVSGPWKHRAQDSEKESALEEAAALAGPAKAKRSYMLPVTAVVTLERVQLGDLIRTGEKPDLSELVAEAIRLLARERGVEGA